MDKICRLKMVAELLLAENWSKKMDKISLDKKVSPY